MPRNSAERSPLSRSLAIFVLKNLVAPNWSQDFYITAPEVILGDIRLNQCRLSKNQMLDPYYQQLKL
jgi:hypothetical protein